MYELFIKSKSLGMYESEIECHQKAEELDLSEYGINLLIFNDFRFIIHDTFYFKT